MEPQRIHADKRIEADRGRIALGFGPLVYNVERADQEDIEKQLSDAPLRAEWRGDLLGGVVAISGKWQDGKPMLAIPNYARMNRTGEASREVLMGDGSINYAPGAPSGGAANAGQANESEPTHSVGLRSQVWINA